MPRLLERRLWLFVGGLALLVGVLLRLWLYCDGRSLFIDEANLALNLTDRSWLAYFAPLEYHQYAPPLFMILSKAVVLLSGYTETSLRLWPLVAGFVSLGLVWALGRQFLPRRWAIMPVILLALNFDAIRYATEFKQYSVDVMVALGLIYLALRFRHHQRFKPTDLIMFAVVGALAVLLSMPSVFILFGIGLYYLTASRKLAIGFAMPVITWLAVFGLWFVAVAWEQMSEPHLTDYHSPWFLTLPNSLESLKVFLRQLQGTLTSGFGHTVVTLIPAMLLVPLGAFFLLRGPDRRLAWLIIAPILATMVASMVGAYSMIPRMMLFLLPAYFFLYVWGLRGLAQRLPAYSYWMALILVLWTAGDRLRLPLLLPDYETEDIRAAMAAIYENRQPGDCVYIHPGAMPAFTFYADHYEGSDTIPRFNNRIIRAERDVAIQHQIEAANCKAFWVVTTNIWPYGISVVEAELARFSTRTHFLEEQGAIAIRAQLTSN